MSYFGDHYDDLRWPLASESRIGFRRPQAGALHAIAAHFTGHRQPAIVTMPTGSGKTAVLSATPFVLRSERALVLTPSRLVREQIAGNLSALKGLRELGAIGAEIPAPRVITVRQRVADASGWEAFADGDVVVGIPASLNSSRNRAPRAPKDLFDLVLVDEAHHSAAKSWRELLDQFPTAHHVLFTATPFRRDRREIDGRFVYTYELRDAFSDGVFGRLEYRPVDPVQGENPDVAIARMAAVTLTDDRVAALDHRLMVRTGSRTRADELAAIYRDNTDLRLETVLGNHSLRHVTRVIQRLSRGEIDGIICVDMLGEGFDLPTLKVAALHAPHKSLAVTLQFIGRFARTTAPNLGRATFLALASEMLIERERLYRQGAAWEEIIPNLSSARVREERETREVLETFEDARPKGATATADSGLADLSLHALKPYHHVKILRAGPDVDLTTVVAFPPGLEVVFQRFSADHAAVVYVTRQVWRPDWSTVEHFDGVAYELFVIHHHRDSGLLFICTSRRVDQIYQCLAAAYAAPGSPPLRGLSHAKLNKVLLDLDSPRFFHIGKKNALAANRAVSYETLAGPNADEAIAQSDARAYRRGHWFCSAKEDGVDITIGLSSASKVWSNAATRIPQLIGWCGRLARKIMSERTATTASGLDILTTGEEATAIPAGVLYASWHPSVYTYPIAIRYDRSGGATTRRQLLDFELQIEKADLRSVTFTIRDDSITYRASFSYDTERCIEPDPTNSVDLVFDGVMDGMSLTTYLNERPPLFYTADFTCLDAFTLHRPQLETLNAFDPERFETPDWVTAGVDIMHEVGPPTPKGKSVHAYLERELAAGSADVVFYDHGSGEIADFVTLAIRGNETHVTLYHCKGSGDEKPGERVEDAYEVCGQVAKSTAWAERRRLLSTISRRFASRGGESRFVKGDIDTARHALGDGRYVRLVMQIVAVQPGLSKAKLSGKVGAILAAADDFIFGGPCARLRVMGSQ